MKLSLYELRDLISVLKEEGVLTYSCGEVELTFHPAALPCALVEEEEPAAEEDIFPEPAPTAPEIPEALKNLNRNYFHPSLGLKFDAK